MTKDYHLIAPDLCSVFALHLQTRVGHCQQALAASEFDTMIIDSGGLKYRFLDDTSYPFRVNPYAARLAPLQDFPESAIIIDATANRPQLLLYQPRDYWHASSTLDCAAIASGFDVTIFAELKQLRAQLPNASATAYIGERPELVSRARANPPSVMAFLDFQQAIKTEYEIECIRRANIKAVRGHQRVAELAGQTTSEYALHQAYLQAINSDENGLPYDNIIAANHNAAILHYTQHQTEAMDLTTLLIDAGATYHGYCSDITRTYTSDNGIFAALIDKMQTIELDICAKIKPGINYLELHRATHQAITSLLIDSEILNCSYDQAMEQELGRIFFPHGVGHLLGVQVHDRGGWQVDASGSLNPPPATFPHLRLTRDIEIDQVFTIEPGLYFIDQLLFDARQKGLAASINWPLVEQLKPFGGIRIEDNLRVTASGSDNLTRKAFDEL